MYYMLFAVEILTWNLFKYLVLKIYLNYISLEVLMGFLLCFPAVVTKFRFNGGNSHRTYM